MNCFIGLSVASLQCVAMLFAGSATPALAANVNCDTPHGSVQKAVDNADGPTTITIEGTCVEDVEVAKDDITMRAKTTRADAKLEGTITLLGQRILIEDLTVAGSGPGIYVRDGASATIQGSDISNNAESGVIVGYEGFANILDNRIVGNGHSEDELGEGIDVFRGGSAFIQDNEIRDSLFTGIFVAEGMAEIRGNTIGGNGLDTHDCGIEAARNGTIRMTGGNHITNSGCCGVCLSRSGVIRQGSGGPPDVIDEVGEFQVAFDVSIGSHVDFRNAEVTGLTIAGPLATVEFRGSKVTGDIQATNDSGVSVRSGSELIGSVTCDPASFTFRSPLVCNQTCAGLVPDMCVPAP